MFLINFVSHIFVTDCSVGFFEGRAFCDFRHRNFITQWGWPSFPPAYYIRRSVTPQIRIRRHVAYIRTPFMFIIDIFVCYILMF